MIDHIGAVNRSVNTTLQHVDSTLDDETVILECIDAAVSIIEPDTRHRDIYRTNTQVRTVFRLGYREELLKLTDSFKLYMLETHFTPSQIDLGFGLLRLKPGVLPISFRFLKHDSFGKFEQDLYVTFSEHFAELGSVDFRKKLYAYFATHGQDREWDHDSLTYISLPGRCERYMAHTALALKDVYGEKKLINFLDRLINEIPPLDTVNFNVEHFKEGSTDPLTIRAVDMLRIIQSGVDLSEAPLHWARQIAAER